MTIDYLGPENSYSEKAAHELIADNTAAFTPCPTFQSIASRVSEDADSLHRGVLPYYNFLEGLVQETLDLIYEYRLTILDVRRVKIVHCLGKFPNDREAHDVFSKSIALAQCSDYLQKHFPGIKRIAVDSTTEGARRVAREKTGLAISAIEALTSNGLEVIASDIGNKKHGRDNATDFYLVGKDAPAIPKNDLRYLTMIAVTPHVDKPGLLAGILSQVAYYGLNNAKIHSRPAIDQVDEIASPQMFYLEIVSRPDDENFIRCVDALRYHLTPRQKDIETVRILGSYRSPE